MPEPPQPTVEGLVRALYPALAEGDAVALGVLLADDFVQELAPGLPGGIGGRRVGAASARDDGWWAIGRAYAVVAHPEEWIPCADGRLLVRGRYAGTVRGGDEPFDAAFAHLWTAADGRLTALWQLTDTARWPPIDG